MFNHSMVFGASTDITTYILEYIGDRKTLQRVSQVNKLIRRTISLKMVMSTTTILGPRHLQNLLNIERMLPIQNEVMFRLLPLRVLRVAELRTKWFWRKSRAMVDLLNNTGTDHTTKTFRQATKHLFSEDEPAEYPYHLRWLQGRHRFTF